MHVRACVHACVRACARVCVCVCVCVGEGDLSQVAMVFLREGIAMCGGLLLCGVIMVTKSFRATSILQPIAIAGGVATVSA